MGLTLSRRCDFANSEFLSAPGEKKHCEYLKYFYSNDIQGSNEEKFQAFRDLVNQSEDLRNVMEEQDLEFPASHNEINEFIDQMTEKQAEQFYHVL